ncbi:MAG: hypothetical protein JJE46_11720 [Acidimicrobiia bacterium]|nr:hypothetical protein [Acidimicrobiia bacterium]
MNTRRFSIMALLGLGSLVAAGCVPLVNAPSGGGAVTTSTYKIGPFNLAALGQPGSESETSKTNVPRPAGAFGVKTMDFDLVDGNGTPIPRHMAHLHHVLLIDSAHTDVLCAGRAERFSGAGAERTPLRLPDPYAYLVGANDRWDSLWHVMNMSDMPMTVYIQYKVGYQTGATAANTRNVVPYFADVTGCGGSVFNVPGNGGMGSVYTKSRTWNAPTDGIMVYAGGHLHGGGIDLTLRDGFSGAQCVMTAHYDMPMGMMDGMHPPMSIDPCPAHNLVIKGKPYTLTARYDNSQPYIDVMGIALAYIWPTS